MRYTIMDLQRDFPDETACLAWLKDYLYPEGILCPNDKKITPHHKLKNRRAYSCELCGHHTYPTANTIFHKSTTPLTLWFYAIYLMASTRAGISAKQLERELGVTYKTAWRMFHQIRKMMGDDGSMLMGEVEVDEAYMQPNSHFTRKGTPKYSKYKRGNNQIIFGAVERGGRVKARHIPKAGVHVVPEVEKLVDKSAHVFSDSYPAYKGLKRLGYTHESVAHMEGVFKVGNVHTQNIENFWSNMKRGIRGVYRHVDPKYLQAYADEYAFRYSNRKHPNMFWAILNKTSKIER